MNLEYIAFSDRLDGLPKPFMEYSDFEQHYEEFKNKIYSYLFYRSGRNRALAEDLTSEVFMKALEKFHTYKPDSSFQSWIFAIAHNHLIDHFRKSRTIVDLDAVENIVEADTDVKSLLRKRIAAEQIVELLDFVSDEEREMLLMRYHQELSHKQIAEISDRSEGNVRVIIHRALSKLQKQYGAIYTTLMLMISLSLFSLLSHFQL